MARARHHQLFIRWDDAHGDAQRRRQSSARQAVPFGIDGHPEKLEPFGDACANGWRVLTDAIGEDQRVAAAERAAASAPIAFRIA
jgi:hypothetical protein